ncbi:MAG: DUF2791 family P-loop domain-containing protein [Candidatus Helarchaeota archaeon]|nr:DUF2791 family P-loop domain-containing protein [Candidatus Helarchaeota archaeon]
MESTGIIDLKFRKRRDFSKFYLLRNPFPAIGIPEDVPLFTANRENEIVRFQNVIAELVDYGSSLLTVMVGEYGSGKSHLFKVFKNSVNTQLLNREDGTLAIYVKTPGEEFKYLFLGFIDDIGRDLLQILSSDLILELMSTNPEYHEYIINQEMKEKIDQETYNAEEILTNSRYKDMFTNIRKTIFTNIQESDVVRAFLHMSHPDKGIASWKWFIGEKLDRQEKETLSMLTTSIDTENAYSLFCDFVQLLHLIGIKNIVLLIDELEKITLISPIRRARYQDNLRQIIDEHPQNVCFYFSIAQRQWSALTREPTALVRRLQGNWHILEPFKKSDVQELIEKYLFSARVLNFSGNVAKKEFPECNPSFCPFNDEAISLIHKKSKGIVSNILLICRSTLNKLIDKSDVYHVIDSNLVEECYPE